MNEKNAGKKQLSIEMSMAKMKIVTAGSMGLRKTAEGGGVSDGGKRLQNTHELVDVEDMVRVSESVKGAHLNGRPVLHQRRLLSETLEANENENGEGCSEEKGTLREGNSL